MRSTAKSAGGDIQLAVAQQRPGTNVNAVTDDAAVDVPSGSTVLFGAAVEVVSAPGL